MSNFQFTNNAQTTLGSSLSAIATTATVATGTGNSFPSLSGGEFFTATLWSAGSTTGVPNEIVYVTARTGDTMTIVRGREGTSASAWNVGDTFANYPTAGFYNDVAFEADVQTQSGNYAVDSGSANAAIITLSPVPASLAALDGVPLRVLKINSASTSSFTINVNSLGATAVVDAGNSALTSGMLPARCLFEVMYNSSLSAFQLIGRSANANQTFTGSTTFANSTAIDSSGKLVQSCNPAIESGPFVYLSPAGSKWTVENSAGTALQIANTTSSVESVESILAISANVYPTAYLFGTSPSQVGSVTYTGGGTGVAFNTTSDELYKDFIGEYDGEKAAQIILADPVRDFHWNGKSVSAGGYAIGWGAQTSHKVSPDLATPGGWFIPAVYEEVETKDEDTGKVSKSRGKEISPSHAAEEGDVGAVYRPWGVDQSKRTPYLWAALAMLLEEREGFKKTIGDLTSRIAALEKPSKKALSTVELPEGDKE